MAARDGRSRQNYLQEHSIPQLFEGLMTGLVYNQPTDPIQFLENAIAKLRKYPDLPLKWDTFITVSPQQQQQRRMNTGENSVSSKQNTSTEAKPQVTTAAEAASSIRNSGKRSPSLSRSNKKNSGQTSGVSDPTSGDQNRRRQSGATNSTEKASSSTSSSRPNSLAQAANNAFIVPDAPIILFMGGPGGGKTRYATQLQDQLKDEGLVHICMPDLVRSAISRYKDKRPEWREASELHQSGELIPNELAQQLVVAEMGKHPQARAFFLEVRPVDMALILDYDEDVLRRHMQARGLLSDVIDRRINEFKEKTLPSAKYFDDQQLLHLIPGERSDSVIIERMKKLTLRAIHAGVGGLVTSSTSASSSATGGIYTRDGSRNKGGSAKSVLGAISSASATPKEENVIPIIMNGGDGTEGNENANRVLNTPKVISATPMPSTTPISTPNSATQQQKALSSNPSTPPRPPTGSKVNGSRKSTPAPAPPGPPSSISSSPIVKNSDEMNDPFPKGLPSEVPVILIIGIFTSIERKLNNSLLKGAPGSNKSNFAQRIARKYEGFIQLSMGELLRRKVLENREDALWSRVGKKMDAGETIPLRICRELIYTTLHERGKNAWGFVLEGYPRSVVQVEDVEAQLGRIDLAILIDCTEPFCNDSLRQRYQRGKEEGAERADDEEAIVRVRLALFKLNTLPMLKHLDDQGLLRVVSRQPHEHDSANSEHQIEGDTDEEKVFQEVCAIIDNTIFVHGFLIINYPSN
uniref:Zeta_toxin domain-containing protein n=1 Tax=Meloidogyne hapla TaxID=6305 RepID=A0A1I8BKM8_MELHA